MPERWITSEIAYPSLKLHMAVKVSVGFASDEVFRSVQYGPHRRITPVLVQQSLTAWSGQAVNVTFSKVKTGCKMAP
ncbi:hypothetical protein F4212_01930 [Candidatus Poribacteria bacterium]|nr:hypothetical protein [Candidatus Poribacteria bacterium]